MTDWLSSNLQNSAVISVSGLLDRCNQLVTASTHISSGYRPAVNQVFFFVLVWLVKQKITFQALGDELRHRDSTALDVGEIDEQIRRVIAHLDEWGDAITGLKQGNMQEWELLRIRMSKAVLHYNCPESVKDEALQNALIKAWHTLERLVNADTIDATPDMIGLVLEQSSKLTGIYDFSSPFYAYASRIAKNELISLFRRDARHSVLSTPLEELADVLPDPAQKFQDEDENIAAERALWEFKSYLQRLLNELHPCLTPGQRQVVIATLAARPQFWRALAITELPVPDGIIAPLGWVTDAELAGKLKMTENNIRVQRTHAKRRISTQDPALGALLERLMAVGGTQD